MKLHCVPKSCCCLRRWSCFGVVVFVVVVAMTSLFTLIEEDFQGRVVRSEITSPLWILPGVTSNSKVSSNIPENWTVFVPKGHSNISNCVSCFHEDDTLLSAVNTWTRNVNSDSLTTTLLRKMARLLFVIEHGATGILLTCDLPSINQTIPRLILDNQPDGAVGMEYAGRDVTTDFFHFHHRLTIPEGNSCKYYRLRKRMKPLWNVGIRCKSVKVAKTNTQTAVLIDPHAPPVFSSGPKFSITQFSDAFFDYEGFWALFITTFSDETKTSLWALLAQRMLQEIHGEMAVTSLACPTDINTPIPIDSQPSKAVKAMHSFVSNWKCSHEMKFYDCAVLLALNLSHANLIENNDVKLAKIWFNSLRKSGYPEPKRNFLTTHEEKYLRGCVIYSPPLINHPSSNTDHLGEIDNSTQYNFMFPNIYPHCKHLPKRQDVVDPFAHHTITKPSRVQDIALVVIFYDSSIYSNIRYLQELYSNYFPHLIYCGPDWKLFQSFYKTFQTPLTYIEVPNTKGFVAYECVSRAMMMNYDVSGYLEMADDVILNTWTLGRIPRDKFWFQKDLKIASRNQQIMHDFALPYPFPWWPWTVHGQMWGAKAMAKVWAKFGHIIQSSSNDTRKKQIVTAFLDTLKHNSGNSENFFYCSSDIFYVPNKFRQEWTWLAEMFFTNNVFLDIAVPTLMNGMDWTENIIRMEGIYLWYNNRGNYPMYYRDFHQFFHPWKMGWIHRSDHANFLCYHVLPYVVTDRTNATIQ